MGESARSKGQRHFIFGWIAVLLALIIVPSAAMAGAYIASGNHSTVLQGQSTITNIEEPNGSAIAYAHSNGTYSWTMPTDVRTAYVVTNLTVDELQAESVDQVTILSNYHGAANITYGVGAAATSFVPYAQTHASNASSVSVGIPTSSLTGSPTQHLILEVQSGVASYGTVSFSVRGDSGLVNWFGPAAAEVLGYIIGGILVWTLAILSMPWYDLEVHRVTKGARKTAQRLFKRRGRGKDRRAAAKEA